ncbi:MAG: isoamylase [Chloroflexota bacterium]|nr:isoamylase [Chloroflexota bacterium]
MRSPRPGRHVPQGATWDGEGTNFSLFAEHADGVELVLLNREGRQDRAFELSERTEFHWHGYVPGVGPGQRYGYRVRGPYRPAVGLRHNPRKLLLDPYAKEIGGDIRWGPEVYGYGLVGDRIDDDQPSQLDSAGSVPHSLVADELFPWGDDRPPLTPWAETVIYEVHVRGFTMLHPGIPPEIRGTYMAMAHPAAIDHLLRLGVTAVELMPVHHFIDARFLVERGLTNYWGYDSIGYFAPAARYARATSHRAQLREFKAMVRALHRAGLEVILDVVYNHTAEGDHRGPTLSLRGIDNPTYYRLDERDPRRYSDVTGTGNTLNARQPQTLRLIMDSLRYWVMEMHVDGFRFDLASALAREFYDVDRLSAFFDIIHQDPVLSQTKLIAEPWDVGEGGYQVGNFPVRWAEWNGRYRDTVRDHWRGQARGVSDLAYRLTGSSDLYQDDGRGPHASVNLVSAHDGFTLRDLVSYNRKHNEANGENNRDGSDDNRSWNCGVEGESDDPAIVELRARQRRNLVATLMVSQGCPMVLHGDELGRTQRGNNNAYCQDNEISWIDWAHLDQPMLDFTRRVLALRHAQPVLRRRHFFQGQVGRGVRRKDIAWFGRDGAEMDDEDWADQRRQSLGMLLDGDLIPERDERGERISGDTLLVLLHAGPEDISWRLPTGWGERWEVLLDTARPAEAEGSRQLGAGCGLAMVSRSLVVLRREGRRGRLALPGRAALRGAKQQGAAEHESDAEDQDVAAGRPGEIGGEETAEQHVGVDLAGQSHPQPEHQGAEQRLPPRRAERTPPPRPAERTDQEAAGAAGGAADDPGVEGADRDGLETRREGGEREE